MKQRDHKIIAKSKKNLARRLARRGPEAGHEPVMRGGSALPLCAALSVMLAWHKADDDVRDMRSPKGFAARIAFSRPYRSARRAYPAEAECIRASLAELSEAEKRAPDAVAFRGSATGSKRAVVTSVSGRAVAPAP